MSASNGGHQLENHVRIRGQQSDDAPHADRLELQSETPLEQQAASAGLQLGACSFFIAVRYTKFPDSDPSSGMLSATFCFIQLLPLPEKLSLRQQGFCRFIHFECMHAERLLLIKCILDVDESIHWITAQHGTEIASTTGEKYLNFSERYCST